MFGSSDPHRFRKTIAGLCMFGAPVLFLIGALVAPKLDSDEATLLGNVAAHADRALTSSLLVLAGMTLFMVAILGLMHMLRERGVAYGHAGGTLALVGIVGAIANATLGLVIWSMAGNGGRGQMVALLHDISHSTATLIVLFALPVLLTLGLIVLCWGLTANHIAPLWMTLPLGLSGVCYAIGTMSYSQPLYIVASALVLIGLAPIGRMVLVESTEDWEHSPDYHGWGALTH
jgi:hypothetical protein